jgi:hypothetical protein
MRIFRVVYQPEYQKHKHNIVHIFIKKKALKKKLKWKMRKK